MFLRHSIYICLCTNSNNTDYRDNPTEPVPSIHWTHNRKDMFDKAAKMNLTSFLAQITRTANQLFSRNETGTN